ncbi:MAG: hypothetical protein AB1529_04050 [Candidatus Micrarchaeota archaeon]
MPKEAFGGDDSGGGAAPEKKRMGLDKFGLMPDANIRDVFWRLMASYAATKKPPEELPRLEQDRFALMRVAISVLSSPNAGDYGLAPKFIAQYSLMMMLDGGWKDALAEFLERSLERKLNMKDEVAGAIRRLMAQERYGKELSELLTAMVRGRGTSHIGLEYVAALEDPALCASMKKELMIIARGDIGRNQMNAIRAVSLLKGDDEVKRSLVVLLSHWDAQARHAAAEALGAYAGDAEVKSAAEKRLSSESDEEIKKLLKRLSE